jgi:hypothetical protein
VGDDTDIVRASKRKQTLQLHKTDATYMTVSRQFISFMTYSQHPHYN